MKKDCICEFADKNLSEKRKIHTEGVRKTAAILAERFGADPEKADIAALCHDIYRGKTVDEINNYVNNIGLDKKYINNPNLAHGKIAAYIMENELGICDEDILNAVKYHTTGRAHMSMLEKIIFVADAIEPGRAYPGVEEIRKAATYDIDLAMLISLNGTIEFLKANKAPLIDRDTVEARDQLEKERGINEQ